MAICCLSLTACIHSPYPPGWPAPAKIGDECPDLSGTYTNLPATQSEYPSGGGLYDEITGEGYLGTHECEYCTVELQWLDDRYDALRVRLIYSVDGKEAPQEATLKRSDGEFICDDRGLSVRFTQGGELIAAGAIQWGYRSFRLAQDGSLLRFETMQTLGHDFVVVPFYLSSDSYARWFRQP